MISVQNAASRDEIWEQMLQEESKELTVDILGVVLDLQKPRLSCQFNTLKKMRKCLYLTFKLAGFRH